MKFLDKFLLKYYIKLYNYLYNKISNILIKLNNGVHPKHELMKYYQFFIDNIEPNSSVLDIGCGIGFVAKKISEKARRVYAIDINKELIQYAKNTHYNENIHYIVGNVLNYEFKEKFDYVILSNVLEHIKDRKKFLLKIKKLAPILLIRVPMIDRSWLPIYLKKNMMEYRLDPSHYIEYTTDTFQEEINNAELKILSYSIQYGEIWAKIGQEDK